MAQQNLYLLPTEKPSRLVLETTIEEAALKLYPRLINDPYNPLEDDNKEERDIWIKGAKWQQEQDKNKYSEEEVIKIIMAHTDYLCNEREAIPLTEWFKRFKK